MDLDGLLDLAARPHVYPVREDTLLLAQATKVWPGGRFVEVGCGSGLASLAAARAGARVVATDRNPFALQGVREEARARGLALDGVRTDLLEGLRRFDVVAFNPPYLPTPPEERDPDPWVNLALDGGTDGREVTRRFLSELPAHLSARGRAYLLWASIPSSASLSAPEPPRVVPGFSRVRIVASRQLPGERLWVLELTGAGEVGESGAAPGQNRSPGESRDVRDDTDRPGAGRAVRRRA